MRAGMWTAAFWGLLGFCLPLLVILFLLALRVGELEETLRAQQVCGTSSEHAHP